MKVILYGYGQMGKKIYRQLLAENHEVLAVVSAVFDEKIEAPMLENLNGFDKEADILIDFSHPTNLQDILNYSQNHQTKLVLATTGYSNDDLQAIKKASEHTAIFQSYNTSFGISMLVQILKQASKQLYDAGFDIEILEKHHHRKIDAPSGTAKLLYDVIENEIEDVHPVYDRSSLHQKREREEVGIQALRGGTIFGEHEIMFAGLDEVIEIKHTALSRDVFVTGAIQAAKVLLNKAPGLYNLKNIY